MDSMNPDEIRQEYGHLPYITPYERIVALVDDTEEAVELHEFHARGRCEGGAAWEVYHYPRTSPLVVSARREGARNIFVCAVGSATLDLAPGIASAGLEEVRLEGGEVSITYAGLAGGGIAATLCRGMAPNVLGTTVHERGGGSGLGRATLRVPAMRKLVVGADDTDDRDRGATWSTMNEIAFRMEWEGACVWLGHTIVQLYPENPYRTTNCCATAVVFAVAPGAEAGVERRAVELLGESSFSDECGAAFFRSIAVPDELRRYSREARSRMVTYEDARRVAEGCEVGLEAVTGRMGCIGALAAVGAHDDPDGAVRPPEADG